MKNGADLFFGAVHVIEYQTRSASASSMPSAAGWVQVVVVATKLPSSPDFRIEVMIQEVFIPLRIFPFFKSFSGYL